MKLRSGPFTAIASGKKTIESRLYDEKRRMIQVGDQILFRNAEAPDQVLLTNVVELLRFETFEVLLSSHPVGHFGGESVEELLEQVYQYYTKEDEAKYGVLGIRIALILADD